MSPERLTLRWVELYTRGLPAGLREERLAEIESDLWEHRRAGASAGAILSRCLRGVLADLGWRRGRRTGRAPADARALLRISGWCAGAVSFVFFVAQHAWFATALLGLDLYGDDQEAGDVERIASISGVLLVLLLAGAALLPRRPRAGAAAVSLAVIVSTGVMWWASPILGPMAIASAAGAVALARRRRTELREVAQRG